MVHITPLPPSVYVVRREHTQHINHDFHIANDTNEEISLERVILRVLDEDGRFVTWSFLDRNALAPSIDTLPQTTFPPHSEALLFNPFHTFDADVPLTRLHCDFVFNVGNVEEGLRVSVEVRPQTYVQKTDLQLPLRGRVLVYDGHDFYSHHRRLDTTSPLLQELGVTSNSGRYACDLVVVDAKSALFQRKGDQCEDWFGYSAEVLAPGMGTVVACQGDVVDNYFEGPFVRSRQAPQLDDPISFMGNHVILDHHNGEYSLLAHLLQGSLRVDRGTGVKHGDVLGRMGFSGSTGNWVHLHYELRDAATFNAEGLPARFTGFTRVLGGKILPGTEGDIDTGDVVEAL